MTVLFGGSFDPPHIAHTEMAEAVANLNETEKLVIIPAFSAPLKNGAKESYKHRFNMCELAFGFIKKAEISNIEEIINLKNKTEKSYTVDTIKTYIAQNNLKEKPYFLIGADSAEHLNEWKNAKELCLICNFLVFKRNGKINTSVLDKLNANYKILDFLPKNYSSTKIRENIAFNDVSEKVKQYIMANSLYNIDEKYKEILQKNMGERRYNHSLNVAEEAIRLAKKYNADENLAYTAGLLHDITKEIPQKTQLKFCSEFGILMNDIEKNSFKLWHAITGAYYVKYILGIENKDIFDAIRYHTTAKPNMPLLSKIIYLADYTSKERDYDGVEDMRKYVDISLEKAMLEALKFTVEDVSAKGLPVHPDTLNALKEAESK